METYEPIDHDPISAEEASAALAAARRSRTRVAWSGYPAWYWLITGAGLGAVACSLVLPRWWDLAIVIPAAAVLFYVAKAAGRARGVCEGWVRSAMTPRETAILYGPAVSLMLANAAISKVATWSSIIVGVVIAVGFAATGLILSTRAARP